MGNPEDGAESYPTAKNLLVSPTRKISVIVKKCHSFPIILTSRFMYTHVMLILINRCLLNVVFSMIKGQSSPKQNLYSPPLFSAIWKTLLLLMLAFLFSHSLLLFRTL